MTIGEAAAPRQPAPFAASIATPSAAPSTPVAQPSPAPAVAQAAKLPDLKIGEAAAPPAVVVAAPSTPIAQQTPAFAAQATKAPDLKIGEAAAPPAVAVAAPSTPIAQQTPAPAAQATKAPDLNTAATAAPQADVVAAQAVKPADPAPTTAPVTQVSVARTATNETQSYAALLAQGVRGPVEVRLADRATMWLPANRVYLDGEQVSPYLMLITAQIECGQTWTNRARGELRPVSAPGLARFVHKVSRAVEVGDERPGSCNSGDFETIFTCAIVLNVLITLMTR